MVVGIEPGKGGMWRCNNLSDTNNNPVFNDVSHGIEELVCNQVLDLPGSKTLIATWDRPGFISADSTVSPAASPFTGVFSDMNAAATSGGDPSFVVATVTDHGYFRYNTSAYSTNGGDNWTDMVSTPRNGDPTPADLKVGEIEDSATDTNLFIWYPRSTNAKVYVSMNRGTSWQERLTNQFTGPGAYFFESRRALVADRVIQRFGMYSWENATVWTSSDALNWTERTGTGLPSYAWWASHQATPGNANDWWFATGFGGGQQGLFRSTNGGLTYSVNPGWQDTWAFGFGKAAPGASYPTMFAYGRRSDQWGLYRSTNTGATWDRCAGYPLGLFDKVTSITGDMDTFGRVHIGYAGNTAVEGYLRSTPAADADANGDGVVDADDLAMVRDQFGRTSSAIIPATADIDGNDRIDAVDLGLISRALVP